MDEVHLKKSNEESLEILRHDAAHVLAEAVQELYPEAKLTIGPTIEDGFYYDFYRETPFTSEDLEGIEARMHQIVKRDEPILREEWTRADALSFFQKQDNRFKVEILEAIPEEEVITVYRQGNFLDPCRGPHFSSTGSLGSAFKLLKVAGAYWRGDSRNPMLQRIYGTAWFSEEDLKAYLRRLEEAEQRDHRRLGRQMDLFHLQEEAQGSVFWHPKGWTLYRLLENYIRNKIEKGGYVEVKTPQLLSRKLWETSGHWEKFRDGMVTCELENTALALKPMNCPCHIEIFKQGLKSYRDLPLRMAEFGSCTRFEPSGALLGLMRLRAFVQDDAHIFCTPEQILSETKIFCDLLKEVYHELGFDEILVRFSDRPAVRMGEDAIWDQAEEALRQGAKAADLSYTLTPGEGAFYGPKLEFVLKDALGRRWQCGTLQVDFLLPQRLGATYVGSDGAKHIPVLLHRAILGSLERFIGVLIEHHGGKFPLWLAPVQVYVLPITNAFDGYATEVLRHLRSAGFRADGDFRNEKVGYKIRELSHQKIPVLFVVGQKEMESGTVALRQLGQTNQEVLELWQAIELLKERVESLR
jgi:threonyl-tRNA synthetase